MQHLLVVRSLLHRVGKVHRGTRWSWLLSDPEAEIQAANAISQLDAYVPLGEMDCSWLRQLLAQADNHELEPFTELLIDAGERRRELMRCWMRWASDCDCREDARHYASGTGGRQPLYGSSGWWMRIGTGWPTFIVPPSISALAASNDKPIFIPSAAQPAPWDSCHMTTDILIPCASGPDIPATLLVPPGAKSIVVLSHGILVDRHENGRFDRLGRILAEHGLASVRMDLAGHGNSAVSPQEATVAHMAYELIDVCKWAHDSLLVFPLLLQAFRERWQRLPITSFAHLSARARWSFSIGVLDSVSTFVLPDLPQMAEVFSPSLLAQARSSGAFDPQPHFTMSREMLFELEHYTVQAAYSAIDRPHIVFHGDQDELVSFARTRRITGENPQCQFVAVPDAVNAFTQSGHEAEIWRMLLEYLAH